MINFLLLTILIVIPKCFLNLRRIFINNLIITYLTTSNLINHFNFLHLFLIKSTSHVNLFNRNFLSRNSLGLSHINLLFSKFLLNLFGLIKFDIMKQLFHYFLLIRIVSRLRFTLRFSIRVWFGHRLDFTSLTQLIINISSKCFSASNSH